MRSVAVRLAAVAALAGFGQAHNVTEWKSRSIYQVMIDRFARTDGSTTAECQDYLFCNGSWAGLTSKLDYIQGMGFTAIQISPVVKNIENDTSVGEPYHGYWSKDLYALNDHFGTADDLNNLIKEVHNRGMWILVDVVVNNMAAAFDNVVPPKVDYSQFNPFNDQKYFHSYCNVTEWTNATNYQDCWLYPYGVALADLKTESAPVPDMFATWIKGLVANYSIDGLRIDAAKHVNNEFLAPFRKAAGVFALGEVLTGEVGDFCPYQTKGYLEGMPNYLDYYPMITAFNGGSMADLATIRASSQNGCNDTLALGTFAENHDMPRFASYNQDMALAKNAMTYVILNDGIPLVYQGQEQHFKGNGTPFNREALWTSGYNTSSELYVLTSKLNKLRNLAINASSSYITSMSTPLVGDTNHLCLAKGPAGSQIVFCINNKSSSGESYQLQVGGFAMSDNVVEVLGCTTTTANGNGDITAYMSKGEPKVWVTSAFANQTGLCSSGTTVASSQNAGSPLQVGRSTLLAVALGCVAFLFA